MSDTESLHQEAAQACFRVDLIRELPFVNETDEGNVTFWNAQPSGHNDTDISIGESYARLTLDVAKQIEMPLLVAMVLRDIGLSQRFTGIEAGYLAAIACAARVGSMN